MEKKSKKIEEEASSLLDKLRATELTDEELKRQFEEFVIYAKTYGKETKEGEV